MHHSALCTLHSALCILFIMNISNYDLRADPTARQHLDNVVGQFLNPKNHQKLLAARVKAFTMCFQTNTGMYEQWEHPLHKMLQTHVKKWAQVSDRMRQISSSCVLLGVRKGFSISQISCLSYLFKHRELCGRVDEKLYSMVQNTPVGSFDDTPRWPDVLRSMHNFCKLQLHTTQGVEYDNMLVCGFKAVCRELKDQEPNLDLNVNLDDIQKTNDVDDDLAMEIAVLGGFIPESMNSSPIETKIIKCIMDFEQKQLNFVISVVLSVQITIRGLNTFRLSRHGVMTRAEFLSSMGDLKLAGIHGLSGENPNIEIFQAPASFCQIYANVECNFIMCTCVLPSAKTTYSLVLELSIFYFVFGSQLNFRTIFHDFLQQQADSSQ